MGVKSGPRIVKEGLVLDIDAAVLRSYSGTGLTANGLVGGIGGTLVNGTGFGTTNNGYFIFDGSNDYINAGNDTIIQVSSGTVSAWTRSSSPGGGFRGIVAKQFAYGMFYNDSVYVAYDWQAPATRTTGLNIADGTWKNVILTFSGGAGNLYLNGASVSNFTYNISNNLSNLFIGAEANANQYAACNISQVLIYNRVLSNQEILQNYNAMKRRYGL